MDSIRWPSSDDSDEDESSSDDKMLDDYKYETSKKRSKVTRRVGRDQLVMIFGGTKRTEIPAPDAPDDEAPPPESDPESSSDYGSERSYDVDILLREILAPLSSAQDKAGEESNEYVVEDVDPTLVSSVTPTKRRVVHVLNSNYSRNTFGDILHASLDQGIKAQDGNPESKHVRQTLFQWIHITDDVLSLKLLQAHINGIESLSSDERKEGAATLLSAQDYERKGSIRKQGEINMNPTFVDRTWIHKSVALGQIEVKSWVQFIIMPFLNCHQQIPPDKDVDSKMINRQTGWEQRRWNRVNTAKDPPHAAPKYADVSNFWALVINNRTLITYSSVSLENLTDPTASIRLSAPMNMQMTTAAQQYLYVSDGGSRTWEIQISQCETWLAFVAHFMDICKNLERDLVLICGDNIVKPENWSRLLRTARQSLTFVTLRARETRGRKKKTVANKLMRVVQQEIGSRQNPESPLDKTLSNKRQEMLPNSSISLESYLSMTMDSGSFHALSWLVDYPSPSPNEKSPGNTTMRNESSSKSKEIIEKLESHLSYRASYRSCQLSTFQEVEQMVNQIEEREKNGRKQELKLLAAFKAIHGFFFPLSDSSSMSRKYWGAVKALMSPESKIPINAQQANDLTTFGIHLVTLQCGLSPSKGFVVSLATIPPEFIKAWIQILTAIMRDNTAEAKWRKSGLMKATDLTSTGWQNILIETLKGSDEKKETALPLGLATLILENVTTTLGGSSELAKLYQERFDNLLLKSQGNPTTRYKVELDDLAREIETLEEVLKDQMRILKSVRKTVGRLSFTSNSSIALERECESSIIMNTLSKIVDQLEQFKSIRDDIMVQGEQEQYNIDTHKDRQENAIYVFTIVTVIFLPLSFMSSLLGMNTVDVRNMETSQWVFWASAIPFTLLVIVGALWGAGEMSLITEGFWRLLGRPPTVIPRPRLPEANKKRRTQHSGESRSTELLSDESDRDLGDY